MTGQGTFLILVPCELLHVTLAHCKYSVPWAYSCLFLSWMVTSRLKSETWLSAQSPKTPRALEPQGCLQAAMDAPEMVLGASAGEQVLESSHLSVSRGLSLLQVQMAKAHSSVCLFARVVQKMLALSSMGSCTYPAQHIAGHLSHLLLWYVTHPIVWGDVFFGFFKVGISPSSLVCLV